MTQYDVHIDITYRCTVCGYSHTNELCPLLRYAELADIAAAQDRAIAEGRCPYCGYTRHQGPCLGRPEPKEQNHEQD